MKFWQPLRKPSPHSLLYCVLVLCMLCAAACGAPTPHPPPPGSPTPARAPLRYFVAGSQIMDSRGRVFVPYGVQLLGMYTTNWRYDVSDAHLTLDQMVAARNFWHANTVSLQLASANLFADTPYDAQYLAKIDQEVRWAHQENVNILLVLQYEATTAQVLPTQDSIEFWDLLSKHYRNAPWVFFDIFNEPRRPAGLSEAQSWPLWARGGLGYVGMQQIVDTIRGNGVQNLVFIDGLAAGEDLQGVLLHRIHGKNIIYAIHPYFGAQHKTRADWDHWFGSVAAKADFPIVADEWGEYQTTNEQCLPQAPILVPQLLDYLKKLHIGVIAWALFPGLLIRGWNYTNPTAFDRPLFLCEAPFPNYDPQAQGIGKMIRRYFAANSIANQ